MMTHQMMTHNPHSTASIAGHPVHAMLIPFPIAFFVATFVCDLVFWRTGNPAWVSPSLWLLGAGLIMAALAALAGLTDLLGDAQIRNLRDVWLHAVGNVIVVLIELYNWYLRYTQGAAAVVPVGLVLSLIVSSSCCSPAGRAGEWSIGIMSASPTDRTKCAERCQRSCCRSNREHARFQPLATRSATHGFHASCRLRPPAEVTFFGVICCGNISRRPRRLLHYIFGWFVPEPAARSHFDPNRSLPGQGCCGSDLHGFLTEAGKTGSKAGEEGHFYRGADHGGLFFRMDRRHNGDW